MSKEELMIFIGKRVRYTTRLKGTREGLFYAITGNCIDVEKDNNRWETIKFDEFVSVEEV